MIKTEIAKGLRGTYGEFMTQREVAEATGKSRNRVGAITGRCDYWQDGRSKKYHVDDIAGAIAQMKTHAGMTC